MKKIFIILVAIFLSLQFIPANSVTNNVVNIKNTKGGVEKQNLKASTSPKTPQYSLEITIKDIPMGQQTLFIPIKLDTMVVDLDKVSLEGLATANILAVASTSMDMAGTGIGLIKFDDNGLPETLKLNISLTSVGVGTSEVSLVMVADESALPSRGLTINNDVKVNVKTNSEIQVVEKIEKGKKKLVLDQSKITLEIQRPSQKQETIFIPILFNNKVVDVDETFGHAIISPGISAKAYGSSSLNNEGGAGIEIVLTDVAEKDFTIDIDLLPKGVGASKLTFALPQTSHTAIISGPTVDIFPTTISVNK